MNLVLSLVNAACKAIAWCIALVLGAGALLLVVTVMSIAYAISQWAGLSFLGFVILVVWMMFYAVKD
jgi:hypothetical protein